MTIRTVFDKPSLLMRMACVAVRLGARKNSKTRERVRDTLMSRTYPQAPKPTAALRRLCTITSEKTAEGFVTWHLEPREKASGCHVLYLHGGAYFEELILPHWWLIDHIIRETGASVTVPLYPLSPEYDHRPAFAMVDALYDRLAAKVGAERIIISGDSAGGGFSVSLAQRIVAAGKPVPGGLLLIAPWMDVTLSAPESAVIEPHDPMLAFGFARLGGEMWAGGSDLRDPAISPGFGPVEGLPPITIFQGTRDILQPDSRAFAERAQQAGIDVRYFEYEGAFHVFSVLPLLPESKDVYRKIGQIFQEHAAHS